MPDASNGFVTAIMSVISGLISGWEFGVYSSVLFFGLISRFKRGFDN
jgi:hypothetical protein